MGTYIIPIDPNHEFYENHDIELARIEVDRHSPEVKLVNYQIDKDKKLFIDALSSERSEDFGREDSKALFYAMSEDPVLFNKVASKLLVKYKISTH